MSSDYLSSLSPSDSGFFNAFTNVPPAHVPRTRKDPADDLQTPDQQTSDQEAAQEKLPFKETLDQALSEPPPRRRAKHTDQQTDQGRASNGEATAMDAVRSESDDSGIFDTDRLLQEVELPAGFVERLQRLF